MEFFFLLEAEAQRSINSHCKPIFGAGWLMSENGCHKRNKLSIVQQSGNVSDTEA